MRILGTAAVATSVVIIPCDKGMPKFAHVKEIPEGKKPIVFGDFARQMAFARPCGCHNSPCEGRLASDWADVTRATCVPVSLTLERHKESMENIKILLKAAMGDSTKAVEMILKL